MSDPDRKTISVPADVFTEAKAAKDGRTWAELVLDGAHADTDDETDGQDREGQDERHPQPLTADDVSMLADEVATEVENRMTGW